MREYSYLDKRAHKVRFKHCVEGSILGTTVLYVGLSRRKEVKVKKKEAKRSSLENQEPAKKKAKKGKKSRRRSKSSSGSKKHKRKGHSKSRGMRLLHPS